MDKDGSGKVTVSDVVNVYDVSKNKEFAEERKAEKTLSKSSWLALKA